MQDSIELAGFEQPHPVMLFADSEEERALWLAAIVATGGRALAAAPIADLHEKLEAGVAARAIVLSFAPGEDASIAAPAGAAVRFAAGTGAALILCVPLDRIDAAIAAVGEEAAIMCQPDFADRVGALASAVARRAPVLAESAGPDGLRLKRLADEVNRIARALAHLSDPPAAGRSSYDPSPAVSDVQLRYRAAPAAAEAIAPGDVRAMLRLRRLRDRFFPGELFADPAWDMLLDLFAARLEGDNVAVSSLCIAAAVPPTTALRWIKTMTDEQLFERHADPMDGRRIFIRLSDRAMDGMHRFFAAADAQGGRMI